MSILHADVYLAPPLPVVPSIPLPYNLPALWTPTTSTLIHSAHSAVLVDPQFTIAGANAVADWITATIPNKTLEYIYITHGHGDHFLGFTTILSRFPSAVPIATKGVLKHMEEQIESPLWENWESWFPGDQLIKPSLSPVQTLTGSLTIELEDHILQAVPVGHSDTNASTVLWVPDLSLVVAGDAVYNGGLQYLAETLTPAARGEWLDALKRIDALNPKSIVTGHKRPGAVDGAWTLQWTRQYIEVWGKVVTETASEGGGALEVFDKVKAAFPDKAGDFILWISALAQFPAKKPE